MLKLPLPFLFVLLLSAHSVSAQYNWQTTAAPAASSRYDDMVWRTPDLGYAIDYTGILRKTTDGGQTWQQLPSPPGNAFRSMAFLTDQIGFIGKLQSASGTTLYRTADGGQSWMPVTISSVPLAVQGFCGMSAVNEQVLYGCGRFNGPAYVYKTTDAGLNWTSIDMSAYAGGLIDCHFWSPDSGIVVGHNGNPWDSGNAVVLFTADGGQTWQNKHTSSRSGELCWKISFPSESTGYVSVYTGTGSAIFVLKTTDKGQTWQELLVANDAYYAEGIGFLNDTVGWLGGGSSNLVYQTTNGGQTWTQVPLGSFLNRFRFFGDSLAYASGAHIHKLDLRTVNSAVQASQLSGNWLSAPAPNPAQSTASVILTLPVTGPVRLLLLDALGKERRVVQQTDKLPAGEHQITFPVNDLSSGVYYLQLQTTAGSQCRRLLVY